MAIRSISIVVAAVVSLGVAHAETKRADTEHAAPDRALEPSKSIATAEPAVLAYRQFVKEQADTLVGMTRSVAREIKDGNLDAAQSTYAPAHRYFERLVPLVATLHDLHASMDARADAYPDGEADARLSGFHRLEYGLFVNKSTAGLTAYADRLYEDSRRLRDATARLDPNPSVLADAATQLVKAVADDKLEGREERYSKTDLWNVEANIEGARQIVTLLQARATPPNDTILAKTSVHFARIDALLEKHKEGCGFKSFDAVGQDDRNALKAAVAALAEQLSILRGTFAMR